MRQWYRKRDLLSEAIEHVIPAESTLDATVARLWKTPDWTAAPPLLVVIPAAGFPLPVRRPRLTNSSA
jgi:hypothetical protein